jgi:ABC-type amino acid transport substrate-binding protein
LKQGLVLLVAVCLSLYSCANSTNGIQAEKNQSLYDRVIGAGKIRCGYIVCPPGCILDPNTKKLSGFGIEALELVAKKLGLTLEWTEEVGWATALEGLQTNRYDMVATPLWTNANRAKLADFSKPLCYNPVYAYARRGDSRFNGHLERINSAAITISTMDGEAGQYIAEADFPKAKCLSMPGMTEPSRLVLNVSTGKADIVFCEPLFAYLFNRDNKNSLVALDDQHPIRLFSNCWMFSRGQFEFKAMLDTVLDEVMNSGAMDKIISKYEPSPNAIYRVALPYRSKSP